MRRVLGLLLLASLGLCACASVDEAGASPLRTATFSAGSARFGATSVELITDGAIAAERLRALINSAEARVDVELYEFDRPDLADALIGAHRRGVRVRVVEDPTVTVNAGTSARLRLAGTEVLIFPVQQRQIDHVKLLIVDPRAAISPGMNCAPISFLNPHFHLPVTT